jgi:NADH-ubiquinone oxidoreductase chain 1
MTEHAAVIFVFFFLAEYASIVLICILITILFLGGYLYYNTAFFILSIIQYIDFDYYSEYMVNREVWFSNPIIEGSLYGISLGLKSSIMIFVFI